MFGWIGLIILVIAYILLITKYSKYFLIIDIIATTFMLIHSFIINDLPFIVVNFLIIVFLSTKVFQGGID